MMDDLTYTLRQLCQRNRDGSHATQADRTRILTLAARQLREAGFRQMKASSLNGKHIQALLGRWQHENLSAGTIKTQLSHLRWWEEKVGKAGILSADNAQLGVPERRYVTNISKARELETTAFAKITDEHVRMSLRLQAASGYDARKPSSFSPSMQTKATISCSKVRGRKAGASAAFPSQHRNSVKCYKRRIDWQTPGH